MISYSLRQTAAAFLILSILTGPDALAFTRLTVSFSQRASKWAIGESSSSSSSSESSKDIPAADKGAGEEEEESSSNIPASSSLVLAPVQVNDENIEFTSGLVGGYLGLTVGGPIIGGITAGLANYASKTEDGPGGEIVRAVAKTAVDVYNFLAELDAKYEITEKGRQSLISAVDWVKQREGVDAEVVEKIEKALVDAVKGLQEINDEYDFTGAGLSLLDSVGDLVEESVKALSGMNKEYQLSDKAMASLTDAIEKTKGKQ